MVLLYDADLHPRVVVVKVHIIRNEAADKKRTISAAHASHVICVRCVRIQPTLVEGIPQLSLRLARKRLVVHLQVAQITVIVLAATVFRRLAVTRISDLAAAPPSASTRRDPVVVVRTPLMAERAVLPDARITVLAPPGRTRVNGSLKGLLFANNFPVLGRANAALPLDCRSNREIVIIIIAPCHPIRDSRSAKQVNHLLGDRHVVRFWTLKMNYL